jgi:hypothetical protein
MATFTVDDLTQLERAIATGARRVKYADREIEYRSLTEMRTLAEEIRRSLGQSSSGLRLGYFQTNKDLG